MEKGQTLVETVIIIVLIFGIFFGLIQLFHMGVLRIVAFDAAQAAVRAKVVNKNAQTAGYYVLSTQLLGKEVIPRIIIRSQTIKPNLRSSQNGNISVSIAEIGYLQKVSFPSLFSVLRLRWLPGKATCPMVNSPEPRYLEKPYPERRDERE